MNGPPKNADHRTGSLDGSDQRALVRGVFNALTCLFRSLSHAFSRIFEMVAGIIVAAASEKDCQRQGKHEESDLVFGFLVHTAVPFPFLMPIATRIS